MSQAEKDLHDYLVLNHASYYVAHDVAILAAQNVFEDIENLQAKTTAVEAGANATMGVAVQKNQAVFRRTFVPNQIKGYNAHFNDTVQ